MSWWKDWTPGWRFKKEGPGFYKGEVTGAKVTRLGRPG